MTTPTASPTASPSRRAPRRAGAAALALTATLALVAASCGDDSDDTSAEGPAGGSEEALTVNVDEPGDGDEVDVPFEVALDVGVPIGEPDTGRHHVHLYYDGNTSEGEYDVVYEPTVTVDRPLDDGEHTIEAVIANADHSLTDARTEVSVTVGDGADATPTDDGY